jgi:hypothetical protein
MTLSSAAIRSANQKLECGASFALGKEHRLGVHTGLAMRHKVMLVHELFNEPDTPRAKGNFSYHANVVHRIVDVHTRHLWPLSTADLILTTSITQNGIPLRDDELVLNVSRRGEEVTPLFSMRIRVFDDHFRILEFFLCPFVTRAALASSTRGICARRRDSERRRMQKKPSIRSFLVCGSPTSIARTDTIALTELAKDAEDVDGGALARCCLSDTLLTPPTADRLVTDPAHPDSRPSPPPISRCNAMILAPQVLRHST